MEQIALVADKNQEATSKEVDVGPQFCFDSKQKLEYIIHVASNFFFDGCPHQMMISYTPTPDVFHCMHRSANIIYIYIYIYKLILTFLTLIIT